ncbi:MAG: Stp1/IreP family PP2C-type Ser/Thr phosphatase [Chitinophagaceae bacterium]|nr:MAG: Stp1/IreP family PP2C-type Ser/Thr phosphatase [Chitinophagaceae bacterium]
MWWKYIFGKRSKQSDKINITNDPGRLQVIIRTDPGNIRQNNEDAAIFFRNADPLITAGKGSLMIVADGMGGHAAGEVASKMATEIIAREYFCLPAKNNIADNLRRSFEIANSGIFRLAASNDLYRGMGTTCSAILLIEDEIYYGHVGDSRAYILSNKRFNRITTDHTYVQELIDSGQISEDCAAIHPKRNILTNAMGTKSSLKVDAGKYPHSFKPNDRLLICSDGLYDYFSDQEMGDILASNSPAAAAEILVQGAKEKGGHDNITVLIATLKDDEKSSVSKETRDISLLITQEYNLP